jgi:hypothetical protein
MIAFKNLRSTFVWHYLLYIFAASNARTESTYQKIEFFEYDSPIKYPTVCRNVAICQKNKFAIHL